MILECHKCGEGEERKKRVKNPTCVKCKAKMAAGYNKKESSKAKKRIYNITRRDKLRQIRAEVERCLAN